MTNKEVKIQTSKEKALILDTQKEVEIKEASRLYRKNKNYLDYIIELRGLKFESLDKSVVNLKKFKKIKTSKTHLASIKKKFPILLKNTRFYNEFLLAIGVDPKRLLKDNFNIRAKTRRITQTEKNTKLREEMDEAMIILTEMNQENIPESKQWELSSRGRRQVDKINNAIKEGGVPKVDGVTELYNINGKLLAKGKEIILEKLDKINIKHFGDLKALSDILDTAFKQNRLISGQSTDNVAVGVHDIYDTIIANQDKKKNVNTNTDNNSTQEN